MGVSQNYGYPSGVPIIRIIVFWGLNWGPPILGNYHIGIMERKMEALRLPQNTGEFFQDDQCLQTDHNSRTQIQGW